MSHPSSPTHPVVTPGPSVSLPTLTPEQALQKLSLEQHATSSQVQLLAKSVQEIQAWLTKQFPAKTPTPASATEVPSTASQSSQNVKPDKDPNLPTYDGTTDPTEYFDYCDDIEVTPTWGSFKKQPPE